MGIADDYFTVCEPELQQLEKQAVKTWLFPAFIFSTQQITYNNGTGYQASQTHCSLTKKCM